MSASKKIIGRDIVEYLRNEALVGRMNKKKLQTLASSMGVLNRVKEEFDKTLSEPESRSNFLMNILDEWSTSGTLKSNNGEELLSILESSNMNLQAKAVKELMKNSGGGSRELVKAPVLFTPTSPISMSSMNGNDTSSKSGIFAFNGGEDEEPIELGSGEQGMRMMEKLSSSEEDNPTTIAEVEDEKENKNSKSPKNRGKNQLGKKSLDRKISKANITSKTTKIVNKKRPGTQSKALKSDRKPTPMKPPPIKKVIKKKPPDKINEILEEFDKDYEEESSSYNIFKNEPQEKKSIPESVNPKKKLDKRPSRLNMIKNPKKIPMRGKNNAFSEKRSTKSTNSFQTIASSSSSSMSANTNSTSTNPKYKNRRIFHVDSDNSEPSEPDDYDILEEVDEDQGSYVSSTRRSRGYRDNKSDDYQEKSAGRKSRSLSSLATRERSPPTNSLRNRRGRTLPRTTSESPLKHQPPPTDKIPEEEDASKLDRRKKYDPGIYNRRRQNKILRTRPSESSSFGDGVRLSKYGTWKEIRKTQREKKLEKEELNTLREDIRDSLSSLDYITEKELSEGGIIHSIYGKIRNDSFLNSICTYNKDILSMIVSVYTSFGSKMTIQTRTQIMIWHILEKLRRFWMYTNQALPTYQEILQDSETVEFLKSIAYLSYMVMNTDACILTGFLENDRAKHKLYISFRHHGIKVEKKRLDTFDIAEYAEDGYGLGGSGMEVQLADCPLVEFLASIHSHTSTKNEPLSKNKILEGLPFLCGLSSEDGSESQKIVRMFLEALSGIPSPNIRKPSHYLDSLSRLWEETQLVFLTCVYEARLRKIQIFPPPDNSKVINLGLTKLHQHELICLSWYLANLDSETVNLEVLMLQDCDIDDDGIKLLGKCIFQKPKKLLLTGNQLSMDGLHSCFKMWKQNDKCYLRSLDMSNCSLDDECLSKLTPILSSLEEIYLNDNYFTWYGVRKISTTRRKTKRLKKIELGRCNINDHAFYELIPLILRTEVVILDGNDLYPLELRIFARHLKEKAGEGSNAMKLKTLVLSNCNLLDDCLFELSRCITYVPNVDLRNNKFTIEGLRTLAKFCRKRDMGELKAINLRGCGITSDEVGELSDVLVKFETLNLAGNNLKGKTGIEEFCQALSSQEVKLKFIDLRHCRLHEHSKKLIQDTCRKLKIDHKIF